MGCHGHSQSTMCALVRSRARPHAGVWPMDLVICGATPLGEALCCDTTLVSLLLCSGALRGRRAAVGGPGAGGTKECYVSCAIWSGSRPSALRPSSVLLRFAKVVVPFGGLSALGNTLRGWPRARPRARWRFPGVRARPCTSPRLQGTTRRAASSDVRMGAKKVGHAFNRRATSSGGTALGCAWPSASPTSMADAPPFERVLDGRAAESSSRPPLRAWEPVVKRSKTDSGPWSCRHKSL